MSDSDRPGDPGDTPTGTTDPPADVPTLEDEYLQTISRRLVHNYDLEQDYRVRGESFALYGHMELHSQKHVLHSALSIAHHEAHEHVFLQRSKTLSQRAIDDAIELGHDLAEAWIDPNEEHYSTEFIFGFVVPEIPTDLASTVRDIDERTLLKFGYNGHYDIGIVLVAPETKQIVASESVDIVDALRTWEPIEQNNTGWLGRLARRLRP